MKKISKYLMLLVVTVLCGGMTVSCSDDDDLSATVPELSGTSISATAVTAQFEIKSRNVTECAYVAQLASDENVPAVEVIFAKGTHFTPSGNGTDTLTVTDLEPNAKYNLYVAAQTTSDNLLDKVESISFTTTDFTDPVTVVKREYDGFTVHLKMPKEVVERKNAIRFTRGVLPLYNMMKMQGVPDAEMLLTNGGDSRCTTQDMTYTFNEKNSLIIDEETGEEYSIDTPVVPGEPSVYLAGEFQFGESDYGWGEGYYNAAFDREKWEEDMFGGSGDDGMLLNAGKNSRTVDEDSYWNGFHHREVVFAKMPEVLDGGIKIDTLKLSPINATLRFSPDKNVQSYCVMVCDDALYNDMLLPMLDNDEKYMQWFTTSYMAFSQIGAQSFSGETEFVLSNFYEEDFIEPGLKFHIFITSLGDENGTSQSYQHLELVTPERTKAAPQVEVKGIKDPSGLNSPYEVWFNIKSTGSVKVEKAKFAANYERDMEYMFSKGYDATSLVMSEGNPFTAEDVEMINSPEGLDVRFDSRANAVTYMAVVGFNDEGLNSEGVVAKQRTCPVPAADKVDSPYLTELNGDWTASAYMSRMNYETGKWEQDAEPTRFKVTIGNELSCPETLPADVYGLYENMKKEEVDALYSEFKNLNKEYAQRLKDQNCLLCNGFNMEGTTDGDLEYKTPYELFVSKDYKGYNNEALFYDFGPKWYLRVDKDGNVSAPINTEYIDPMSNWKSNGYYRNTYYFVGLGEKAYVGTTKSSDSEWSAFPVEVSKDMKTITVNPIKAKDNMGVEALYYPSVVSMRYGQAVPAASCKVTSAVTLTKGWNAATADKNVKHAASTKAVKGVKSINGKSFTPKARPMGRTFFAKKNVSAKRVVLKHRVRPEEFKNGMLKLANQMLNKARNNK